MVGICVYYFERWFGRFFGGYGVGLVVVGLVVYYWVLWVWEDLCIFCVVVWLVGLVVLGVVIEC